MSMQSHRTCFFVDMYEAFSDIYTQEWNFRVINFTKYDSPKQLQCSSYTVCEGIHFPTFVLQINIFQLSNVCRSDGV